MDKKSVVLVNFLEVGEDVILVLAFYCYRHPPSSHFLLVLVLLGVFVLLFLALPWYSLSY